MSPREAAWSAEELYVNYAKERGMKRGIHLAEVRGLVHSAFEGLGDARKIRGPAKVFFDALDQEIRDYVTGIVDRPKPPELVFVPHHGEKLCSHRRVSGAAPSPSAFNNLAECRGEDLVYAAYRREDS